MNNSEYPFPVKELEAFRHFGMGIAHDMSEERTIEVSSGFVSDHLISIQMT